MAVKLIKNAINPISLEQKQPGPEKKYFFETAVSNLDAVGYLFNKSFMNENLIGQIYTSFYENNSDYKYDDNYSIHADPQLGDYQEYLSFFEGSRNAKETAKLIQELKYEQLAGTLAPISVVGTLMGAITDPSTLLLAGRGAKLITTQAGGKTFMKPYATGAILSAEEGAKQYYSDDRSLETSMMVGGVGFLLPGLYNKLIGIKNLPVKADLAKYEEYTDTANYMNTKNAAKNADESLDIDYSFLDPNKRQTPNSVGASGTPGISYPSYNEAKVGEAIYSTKTGLENSPLTPLFRTLQKDSLVVRETGTELVEIPLYQNKNFAPFNEATTISIENEVKRNTSLIINNLRSVDKHYDEYLKAESKRYGKEYGFATKTYKKAFGGKDELSLVKFRKEISKALVNGLKHENPHVVEAARNIRENFFNILGKRADESGMFLIMPRKQLNFWQSKLDELKRSGQNTIKIDDQIYSSKKINDEIAAVESQIKYLSENNGLMKDYIPRYYRKDLIRKRKAEFTNLIYRALLKENPNAKIKDAESVVDNILTQQPFYKIKSWKDLVETNKGFTSPMGISDHVKSRRIRLNDNELIDAGFIEADIEGLMRAYYRSVMPDIVLTERFGDPGMIGINYAAGGYKKGLIQIFAEYQARILAAPKSQKAKIKRDMAEAMDDLQDLRDLIRGTAGLPANPESAFSRTVRVGKNVTAMTYLSGILAAVPDVARLVMADGVKRNFGRLYEAFFNDMGWRMLKLSKRDAQLTGEAADMYLGTRAALFADTGDIFGLMNSVERATGQITNFYFSYINGMNLWNTGVKNIASLVNGSKILDYVEALATGKKIGVKERAQLNNLFIDEVMAQKIYKEYQLHGLGKGATESAGYERLRVARADNWTDSVARETYLSALQKDINITIVTPGKADVPMWMNTEIGGVLSQFKKFGMAATQRILMRGMQERDNNFMIGVVGLISLGAMVDAFRQRQFGLDYKKKKFGDKLMGAIDRSAVLGIFSDVNRMVETLSNNRIGLSQMVGGGRQYKPTYKQKMGLAGPSGSYIANLYDIMLDWGKGTHDYTTARAIRKTLPFQNIWYLDSVFDKIEKGLY